jgi:hypothetical protein
MCKAERLALYKAAASCGRGSNSIHGKVYDWWAEINEAVFDGALDPCQIVIGITEHSGCLGFCSMVGDQARITLHQALIYPANTEEDKAARRRGEVPTRWGMPKAWMGEQLLKDVLLHEMGHQWQAATVTDPAELAAIHKDAHHCDSWAAFCNRAANHLGIEGTWYPIQKRRKTAAIKNDQGEIIQGRKNIWVPANAANQPAGTRIAELEELSGFPHATFAALGLAEQRYGNG